MYKNNTRSSNKTSSKKKKGILFGIPLFLLLCGIALITFAGWNLIQQAYLVGTIITNPPVKDVPMKKFVINNKQITYPRNGEQLGTIIIPSISLNYPIIEGDDDANLTKGVGHDTSTPIPGQNGDVFLAAHRDTMFRNLGQAKIGDIITLKTSYGTYNYKINKIRIVDENDRNAYEISTNEMLTLCTCYPFVYIGHAPQRYLVMAEFVNSTDTSEIK